MKLLAVSLLHTVIIHSCSVRIYQTIEKQPKGANTAGTCEVQGESK